MTYVVEQKWSPTKRRLTKKWVVRTDVYNGNKKLYEASSYSAATKWLRKKK